MKTIRRAKLKDAKKIHAVHMRSIQAVCANHHTPEEIKAWGFRPYNEESRHRAIQHQYVWVIDNDGEIEGYGHLGVTQGEGKMVAHIYNPFMKIKLNLKVTDVGELVTIIKRYPLATVSRT